MSQLNNSEERQAYISVGISATKKRKRERIKHQKYELECVQKVQKLNQLWKFYKWAVSETQKYRGIIFLETFS